jgi:hypothetical protein
LKRILLALLISFSACQSADAYQHVLFIANQQTATVNEESVTFYVLHLGATVYRIGTAVIEEPYATTYNYHKIDIFPLAHAGATYLLDTIVPDGYVNLASSMTEFTAWSYTDLAARVINAQVSDVVLKKFLRVRYTVTPIDEEDSGNRDGTIEEYEADVAAGKAWGRAYIPHKWLGVDYEHEE